ncbi:MAG: ABC transporter substrate-binding protein [Chloroflexi bacterium]|nr:ABC transporter substrate-binding protein [Chloroflexota bacterium]
MRIFFVLTAISLVLAACGPAATATPTPTPPASSRPQATATIPPLPTATPSGGTPVAKPTPTSTPIAAPTSAPASAGPRQGGVLRFPVRGDPPSWDPAVSRLTPGLETKYSVFSRLLTQWPDPPTMDCRTEFQPWLVQQWRWVDDRTAEFTLRQGVKFHNKAPVNGREITAQDAVFSLEGWRKQDRIGPKLKQVDLITAVDRYTFRMRTINPWGGMPLEVLGHDYGTAVLAPEAGGAKGELWESPEKSWIGSGGFVFEKWTPGVKWTLVRNPDYWRPGKPYLDGIDFVIMPDTSTQISALRSRKLELAIRWPEITLEDIKKSVPGVQVVRCPSSNTFPGVLYMNTTAPPFDDVRVRRAVSMAIDRQALVDTVHSGKATIFPVLRPGVPYALATNDLPPELRQYVEYHPDRARQLLAEAGYSKGLKTTVNASARYIENNYRPAAEAVTGMLQAVGLDVKLNLMEHGRYTATVLQASYPVGEMALTVILQDTPEDSTSLANPTKYGGTTNRSSVSDPQYLSMYEEFLASRDDAKRAQLARDMQLRHVELAYRVLLPFVDDVLIAAPGVGIPGYRGHGWEISALLENTYLSR